MKKLILIFILFFSIPLFSQQGRDKDKEREEERRKSEVGIWIGASNPFPGTPSQQVLDTTLGFGLFGRIPWPYFFYTELGGSYSVFLSQTERALTTIPIYAALAYQLPIDIPVKFFLKAGGGQAYVVVRPENTARWNPLVYGGFEGSFIAGRKVRIGIRIDYNKIIESNLRLPQEYQFPLQSTAQDLRLPNPNLFQLRDGDFFHFGLMVSLLF